MSLLCWFLLFSVIAVHGTDGGACTGNLNFINPSEWPVLGRLRSKLRNARFVNVAIHQNSQMQAVVYTQMRQTYIYGPPSSYGTYAGYNYVRELKEIRGFDIKDILFGWNFMAVLNYDGTVWTAGQNYHGQLSGGTTDRARLARVNLPGRVKELAVGYHSCVVVTTDGHLLSWGYNLYGNLGFNTVSYTNPYPRRFTLGRGVSRPYKICCGAYACTVLTLHSGVYSWGYPQDIGRTGDNRIPGRVLGIPSNQNIIKLSCGIDHTVAVSSTGQLYGWGRNNYGELLQTRSGATHATVLGVRVSDAVAGRFITVIRYDSGTSEVFGRYNGRDYLNAISTSSHSPRDLMARSKLGSETKGAVGVCD